MRIHALTIIAFAVWLTISVSVRAQFTLQQPDQEIDPAQTAAIVERIVESLHKDYIFLETAERMSQALRSSSEKKEYDKIASAKKLAETLTEQLQGISHDKHLRVVYSSKTLPAQEPEEEEKLDPAKRQEMLAQAKARGAADKFGFEKVERHDGNVGYILLRGFHPAELGGEQAAAAMNAVADTDALIIDLRSNGGGAPSMVALLCSYLFSADPVHLNDLYFRSRGTTHQWWTLPFVPGTRYEDKPVYVLTSQRTFSAAEEFAYNLKNLKRATIVGETTGGGAHPGKRERLDDHFAMFVPNGRAINPITKTNWEGTGVEPDIAVPADRALKTAHLAALKALIPTNEARLEQIKKSRDALEQELQAAGP
jgi:C-terminal processing protease CtpA/Prc